MVIRKKIEKTGLSQTLWNTLEKFVSYLQKFLPFPQKV